MQGINIGINIGVTTNYSSGIQIEYFDEFVQQDDASFFLLQNGADRLIPNTQP